MAIRTYLIMCILVVFVKSSQAQSDYVQTDSTSLALYNAAEWKALIVFGENSIDKGEDFPLLRLRLAYAYFVRQKYGSALKQYSHILKDDRFNQTALYYTYLCNVYLNRLEDAAYLAKDLEEKNIEGKKASSFKMLSAGFESGLKFTDVFERGNSTYNRAFVNTRLFYKLNLSQSFVYYRQPVRNDNIRQPEYYAKLNYTPFRKINLIGAYHYMKSNLFNQDFQNNTGLVGFRYAASNYDVQVDFILSQIGTEDTKQYNLKFVKYITNNLNLYSISRLSLLAVLGNDNFVYHQLIGFRPAHKLWLETSATLGDQYNYADADALYIYNGFDKTRFKAATNCYFLLKEHLVFGLNYTFERKSDNIFRFNYLQHSFNGSITWNF